MPKPACVTIRNVRTIDPSGTAWVTDCSQHGLGLTLWASHLGASLDVLGHVAHFHTYPRHNTAGYRASGTTPDPETGSTTP